MRMIQRPKFNEHVFKVLVIGEAGTGKTSFIKRYVDRLFSRAYKATIAVDFALKNIYLNEQTLIRLQLWDIAGQERYGSMTRAFYKDALGALIVFDVSRTNTLESVVRWKQDLDSKVSLSDGSPIPSLLLANKCDLLQLSKEDEYSLREFAKQNNFICHMQTSPKDNINIEAAVLTLVKEIVKRQQSLNNLGDENEQIDDLLTSGSSILRHENMTLNNSQFNNHENNNKFSKVTPSCCR